MHSHHLGFVCCDYPWSHNKREVLYWVVDYRKVVQPLVFIPFGHFSRYSLKCMIGHLSWHPVANILGITCLGLMLNPPCLSLWDLQQKLEIHFHRNCAAGWSPPLSFVGVLCLPCRQKCWVSSQHMALIRALGVALPSWPFCHRTSSSCFVKPCARFGHFPHLPL